jgi:hypothetical protein
LKLHPDQWGPEFGTIRRADKAGFLTVILLFSVGFVLCLVLLAFEVLRLIGGSDTPIRARLVAVLVLSPFPLVLIARLEYRIWARAKNRRTYD